MSTTDQTAALAAARAFADQASAVAGKLKPGTFEAVQALALTSIAHSLAVIADNAARPS